MKRPRALPRVLGLLDVGILSSASMGPAYSLASTMGPMVAAAGTRALAALVALTGVMTLVALTFARLSRRFPDAGSSYSWIARAYGARGGGYAAWLLLLSNFFATMTTALPAAVYTLALVAPAHATDPRWDALVGTLWIAASTALLWFGLRPTALLTALFLLVELLVLAASALCALAIHAPPEHFSSAALAAARPALLPGLGGIAAAMVLGIWMTDGWEVSASASEETRGSNATAGRGGLLGLLVTAAILIGAMAAYFRVGSVTGFVANQSDALGYVAQRLGGGPWTFALDATVLVSSGSALWTTMLYLSRSVYAMGRDGLFPRAIGQLDRRGVPSPALALIFVSVGACTLLTGLWPSATIVLNLVLGGTSVFLGALFALSCLAATRLVNERAAPVVALLALTAMIGLDIGNSDPTTRAIELGGLALGLPFALWSAARLARLRAGEVLAGSLPL